MKRNLKLLIFIIFTLVVLLVLGKYIFFNQQTNKKSKASVTPIILLRLDPLPVQVGQNSTFSYTIKAKSNQNLNIIGYLFTIDFDKTKIQVNTIEYKTGVISQDLGQDVSNKDVINQLGKIKIQAEIPTTQGLLLIQDTDNNLVIINGKILTAGIPQLTLSNMKFYQINADLTLSEISGEVASSSSSVASSSSSNQSSSSSSAQGSVGIALKIKYKMQGVLNWIANQTVSTKITILKNGTAITSTPNSFTVSLLSDLLWHGQIEQQLLSGNDYALLIKPDKHLQRKVCSLSARDSTTLYSCGQDKMTLSSTTTDLDLSGLTFFAGDITDDYGGPPDGVANSSDYSMIQKIIESNSGKDPIQVKKADLNYDGIVDTQDASLIIEVWQKGINQDEK